MYRFTRKIEVLQANIDTLDECMSTHIRGVKSTIANDDNLHSFIRRKCDITIPQDGMVFCYFSIDLVIIDYDKLAEILSFLESKLSIEDIMKLNKMLSFS